MLQIIQNVLDEQELGQIRKVLDSAEFRDGGSSASGMARAVKRNLQLDQARHGSLVDSIRDRLLANAEFKRIAMPIRLAGMQLARYEPGMRYGNHVDGAMINNVRTDLSFTLWLSEPATYSGGELVVLGSIGEVRLRPPAGSLVLYSSGAVHRVQPVESGRREVVIGWVQSLIRDDRQREVVADLGWLLKDYLRRMGSDPHAELLLKCQQNLSRMWIDPQSQ